MRPIQSRIERPRSTSIVPPLLGVFLGAVSVSGSTAAEERVRVDVSHDGTRLSLELADAPLAEVLEQIAIEAGIALKMRGRLDERLTLQIRDKPIERALARVLDTRSYAMSFAPADGQARVPLPRLLVVFERSREERPRGSGSPDVGDRAAPWPDLTPEDQEQLEILRALRRVDPGEAMRPLAALLRHAVHPQVRQSAIAALAEIDAVTASRAVKGAIQDADLAVREQALRALMTIDPAAATEELKKLLRGHRDPQIRAFAASALAVHAPRESEAVLLVATTDPHSLVREAAEQALAQD